MTASPADSRVHPRTAIRVVAVGLLGRLHGAMLKRLAPGAIGPCVADARPHSATSRTSRAAPANPAGAPGYLSGSSRAAEFWLGHELSAVIATGTPGEIGNVCTSRDVVI